MNRFIIFLLIIFLTGCAAKPGAEKAAQPGGSDMPLSGKKATAWPGAKDDLEAGGADYTGGAVAVDGKIITASGPAAAREFGEKIVEALEK